jgi:hypothetical protein
MSHDTAAAAALAAILGLAGGIFGLVYFAALRRTTALLAAGAGWSGPLALTLARILGALAFLTLAARLGAVPLLAAFAGFLAARAITLRFARRTR